MVTLALVKFWFLNTNGADAPFHQLQLYKDLENLRPYAPRLVEAAVARLQNHLWYLSEEISVLALTSSLVHPEEKASMAQVD